MDAPTRHDKVLRPFQIQIDRQIALQRLNMGESAFARNYPHLDHPVHGDDYALGRLPLGAKK